MKINILKESKEEIEFEIESLTLAEILRVYLNKNPSVTFVAWKRKHPSENPIMMVKAKEKTAKKALIEAVSSITDDLNNALSDFKKMKKAQ